MRDNPYKKLPPTDNSSAYTLFSVSSLEGIEYKLKSFNEFEGPAKGYSFTNKACCATLIWSGSAGNQVPTKLFSENSVKSRVGVVLDPTRVDVPHADFIARNSGGIFKQEQIKTDLSKDYPKITSKYVNKNKSGQLRFLRGGGEGIIPFFATNHAKWDAEIKSAELVASIEIFAKNVWLKFHGTKKEKLMFEGSERYGGKGKMRYNEALCYRKKGGENPIDGVFINLTNGDIDGLKREEVDGVFEILRNNPRLKLYFYDSDSQDHIIRFCENAQGMEILQKGVDHIKTKSFFQTLKLLTERKYEETKVSGALAASVKKTPDLGQKAREFLREKQFSSIFENLTFEQRKKLLLYSWGANVEDPTRDYDNFKNEFKEQSIIDSNLEDHKLNQIFNDEARKEMIKIVGKEGKYGVFLVKYQKKMEELGLPAFLSEEAFINAKSEMTALIQKDFQEVNLQIQQVQSCKYDKKEPSVPRLEECEKVEIYYKRATLTEFQEMLTDTKVLGAKYYNPYSGEIESFPTNHKDLTIRHLHILARNENYNTTGKMKEGLYCGLLTLDQIAKLRCLVKATNIGAIGKVKSWGGYGDSSDPRNYTPPQDFIIIDQSGFQWQEDLRNSGGLFFYPDDHSQVQVPNYRTWQEETYKAMYGKDRGALSSSYVNISWNGVNGKMDLDKVAEAIKYEFLEALNTAKNQGESFGEDEKINFRFLKAGLGFFCSGVEPIKGDLELARLKGINSALQSIVEIDESNRLKFLGKIKSIELPFSEPDDSTSASSKDKEIKDELKKIENKLITLGLKFDFSKKDALSKKEGYITAVTNCGDPHALFGNEGGYNSVDAAISSNMFNPNILNPLINQDMKLVEIDQDLKFAEEYSSAPTSAPTSDPPKATIVGGLIGGALGAGAGFLGANLLITTTSLAMVIPPVGITVVTVGAVGVLGIVAGVHISKTIAQQIDNKSIEKLV